MISHYTACPTIKLYVHNTKSANVTSVSACKLGPYYIEFLSLSTSEAVV